MSDFRDLTFAILKVLLLKKERKIREILTRRKVFFESSYISFLSDKPNLKCIYHENECCILHG